MGYLFPQHGVTIDRFIIEAVMFWSVYQPQKPYIINQDSLKKKSPGFILEGLFPPLFKNTLVEKLKEKYLMSQKVLGSRCSVTFSSYLKH